jgi:hypothetical protein
MIALIDCGTNRITTELVKIFHAFSDYLQRLFDRWINWELTIFLKIIVVA